MGDKDAGGTRTLLGGGQGHWGQGHCWWGDKDAGATSTLHAPAADSGDRNVACAERLGGVRGQLGRLWGPDRRAATLGAGGNGARVPRRGRGGVGGRERCRPPGPARRGPPPHPDPAARERGLGEQPVSFGGAGRRLCGVTLGRRPSRSGPGLWTPDSPGRAGPGAGRGGGGGRGPEAAPRAGAAYTPPPPAPGASVSSSVAWGRGGLRGAGGGVCGRAAVSSDSRSWLRGGPRGRAPGARSTEGRKQCGGRLAGSVGGACTPDFGVLSSSPALGVEMTKKKKNNPKQNCRFMAILLR